MTVSYDTVIRAFGTNAGIEVPPDVLTELGAGRRPKVRIRVNDYRFAATVGAMAGLALISLSRAHRDASGLRAGQEVHIELELDTARTEVEVPEVLAARLADAGLTDAFGRLAPSRRKEHARQIAEARTEETRERRLAKIITQLTSA